MNANAGVCGSSRAGAARSRASGAFTLIELLVVVAIIGLLVTMVMPTLSRARGLARMTVCESNQHSIVQALNAYHTQYSYFPYNYAYGYPPYSNWGPNGELRYLSRWALGCLSEMLGGPKGKTDLRGLEEGEFPASYICPGANLDAVYAANDNDRYHACYWTNVAIRVNVGLWDEDGNHALISPNDGTLDRSQWIIADNRGGGGAGDARFGGKMCPNYNSWHWRHLYHPTLDSIGMPSGAVFSGDTKDIYFKVGNTTYAPGQWFMHPSWGITEVSCGFERHLGKMVVSFVDGHVGTFTREQTHDVAKYGSPYGNGLCSSAWLMEYVGDDGCGGSRIHYIRPGPVN